MPRAAVSDLEAPTGEYRLLDVSSAPGRPEAFNGTVWIFGWVTLLCQVSSRSAADKMLSKAFPECPPLGGAEKVAEICRHAMIVYSRESNHPCPAMMGDHPNPLRSKIEAALRDPTPAASGQKSSD